ncbi:Lrp/AsnC family transcriptional regulator [Candidatus Pacearchaeota archaeon]|nr:Lrp/AsnC family transcriptional regulator [Candidatus Pacearchaeota archaeon]
MELKIDKIDRRIIYELDINARIPVTQLSRKLHLSREKVNYRINNLIKRGIIRKFVTMINPVKLGYSVYKMFFKFQNLEKEKEKQMISYLMKNDYIYWIASAQGRWDLNITVFAKDINHFDEILSDFISKYGKYILEQEFNTTLKVGILSKNWVLEKDEFERKIVIFGGRVENIPIDKVDVEILRILANNGRMNSTEIASKINSTERKVIYRMKNLEKLGIILGYTTSLNLELLDMQFFKATIDLNLLSQDEKNKLIEYCRINPNVGFFVFCVGSWPFEAEFIVKNNKQFYGVIDDLRQKFPEIKGFETIIFPIEYKFDWMPLCYKSEN